MLTELKGSSLNQVVKVKPVSWGHLVRGGTITALPALPGNEKNTSGPDLKRERRNYQERNICICRGANKLP